MERRSALLAAAVVLPALAVGGAAYGVVGGQRDGAVARATALQAELTRVSQAQATREAEIAGLQRRVDSLSQRWVASGGGTNRKLMPDASGRPAIELLEVFSFDRNHAFCRVDTNAATFYMPTYAMGVVPIPAGSFFMAMASTSIDQFEAKALPEGKASATLRGVLDCHTEVITATTTVGSRTAGEPAAYEIVAVDAGQGGGGRGDTFAFTVFFDEQTAPLNFAIFGPKATFTGDMIEGEITIRDLASLAP
jgi:hypothetical protein